MIIQVGFFANLYLLYLLFLANFLIYSLFLQFLEVFLKACLSTGFHLIENNFTLTKLFKYINRDQINKYIKCCIFTSLIKLRELLHETIFTLALFSFAFSLKFPHFYCSHPILWPSAFVLPKCFYYPM